MDCTFCRIVNNDSLATLIFEDEFCIVIKTIEPVSKGHVLVIPKKHFENILDIDDSTLAHIAVISKKVSNKLIVDNNASGINLLHAAGEEAQQSVFHFHFHLVPRYKDDGLDLWFRNSL